jgi:F-type H+-transporting ATPase subunit gamma
MAGGSQRVYKQRIKSTQSLKKMFRAQELIAASRIGKARARSASAAPYERAITRAVSAVATHSSTNHPLTTERHESNRAAVVVVSSDREVADGVRRHGAYPMGADSLLRRLSRS